MSKVWKIVAQGAPVSYLPIPKTSYEPKPFYSLFKKIDGRWFQVRCVAYAPEYAAKVWGEFIVRNPYNYSIRKAVINLNEAQ